MQIKVVFFILGQLLRFLSFFMLIPAAISLFYNEADFKAFSLSACVTFVTGLILYYLFRDKREDINLRLKDGFAVVTFSWLVASFFGAMPYFISGACPNFIDAFFESISGFTTTGASILGNVEALPHGIIFWRDFTHWLGGMGIIILAVAVFPALGVGGMQLFNMEASGPVQEKLKPRIISTARSLWGVYFILTIAGIILLWFFGMPLFDSVCHCFGAIATGGFSIKNSSISHYGNPVIEMIIALLMFLGGINFVLHYQAITGNYSRVFKDRQLRFYIGLILLATVLITFNLFGRTYSSLWESLRYSVFQVISINTATGFSTADFDLWPEFSKCLLFLLMFIGGCAGSTSGGMKIIRIQIILKELYRTLVRLIYPKAVIPIRLGDVRIDNNITSEVSSFLLFYILIFILSTLIMSFLGMDIISASSSVAATIGTVGPGLGLVGPAKNYAMIPGLGKLVLSVCMLFGRLEMFTVLVLLLPSAWKK